MMRYILPGIFDRGKIISAVSTRNGGVSPGEFASLNMGKSTQDDPEYVKQNRQLFFRDLGIDESQTALSYQVHSDNILITKKPCRENGFDSLITNERNLFLVVSLADCAPVLIHDPAKNVVAAVHSGWRGTAAKIITKTVGKMTEQFNSDPGNLRVYLGPCIGYKHFEVGKEVADQFPESVKRLDLESGKYFVDLKAALAIECKKAGILEKNTEISPFCTFQEQHLFFSHRRDNGKTGRMIAVIGMK